MNFLVRCVSFKIVPHTLIPAVQRVHQYSQVGRKLDSDLLRIYRFPYVAHASMVMKLRNVFCGVSALIAPIYAITLYNNNSFGDFLLGLLAITGYLSIKFLIIGYLTNNLIGIVYKIKFNREQVKIAYIDNWGKRVDIIVKISDIQKTCLKKNNKYNFFFNKIYINGMEKPLKMNLSHATINDDIVYNIFCEESVSKKAKFSF